eukprot:142151_1
MMALWLWFVVVQFVMMNVAVDGLPRLVAAYKRERATPYLRQERHRYVGDGFSKRMNGFSPFRNVLLFSQDTSSTVQSEKTGKRDTRPATSVQHTRFPLLSPAQKTDIDHKNNKNYVSW